MINFFRKIRQKLLSENKVSKYLLYALGEILLLVIGILIALQVNNWNEERIERNELRGKLKSQIAAMKKDGDNLLFAIEVTTFRIYAIQRVLKLANVKHRAFKHWEESGISVLPDVETRFWQGQYPNRFDRQFIEMTFELAGSNEVYRLNTTVFEELVSSGSFSKIQNDTLKNDLNNWYAIWDSEVNIKFKDVQMSWRQALREQGALIYDIEEIENPLHLLTDSPETLAALKEVMYESIWMGQQIIWATEFIDSSITRIEKEIQLLE